MKRVACSILAVLFPLFLLGQTGVTYTYDNAGNRVKREYSDEGLFPMKSGGRTRPENTLPSSSKQVFPVPIPTGHLRGLGELAPEPQVIFDPDDGGMSHQSDGFVFPEKPVFSSDLSLPFNALDTSLAVKKIPYTTNITQTGGRTYFIPFATASGLKSVPQLGLQYNSQSGNGLAGHGWNLSGPAAIVLTNKNLYYHGEVAPANIKATSQAWSLTGIPIVQNGHSGTSSVWPLATAHGNVLIKRIYLYNWNAVQYFLARYPDGRNVTYGWPNDDEARSTYPPTQETDALGYVTTYTWSASTSDDATRYLTRIDYGGNG